MCVCVFEPLFSILFVRYFFVSENICHRIYGQQNRDRKLEFSFTDAILRTGIKMYVRFYFSFSFHRIFQVLCSTTMWGNASEYVIYGLKLVFSPRFKLQTPLSQTFCLTVPQFFFSFRFCYFHSPLQRNSTVWRTQKKKCLECPAYHGILILCFKAPTNTHFMCHRPTVRIEQTTDRHNEHQLMKFTSKCNAVNTQRNVKSAREYSIDVYSMAKI